MSASAPAENPEPAPAAAVANDAQAATSASATANEGEEEVNPPPEEAKVPTRKDVSLKEFINKMDDYAPIVSFSFFGSPPPLSNPSPYLPPSTPYYAPARQRRRRLLLLLPLAAAPVAWEGGPGICMLIGRARARALSMDRSPTR